MSTLISLKSTFLSKWEATLPAKMLPAGPVQKDRMDSIVTAVLTAGDITIKATTINGGIIVGGASPPGGPVVGALMSAPPGSIVSGTPWDSSAVFIPPMTVVGSAVVVYTDWLKTLQTTISDAIKDFWSAWFPAWSCSSVASLGGVAGWSPSPSPGPWVGGTITPFTLLGGQGVNSSPALTSLKQQLVAKCRITTINTYNGQTSTLIPPQNDEIMLGQIESFCDTFSTVFNSWASSALVTDTSGAAAMGTSVPPSGSIIGGSISGLTII